MGEPIRGGQKMSEIVGGREGNSILLGLYPS
jgi:hypothetical protein